MRAGSIGTKSKGNGSPDCKRGSLEGDGSVDRSLPVPSARHSCLERWQ